MPGRVEPTIILVTKHLFAPKPCLESFNRHCSPGMLERLGWGLPAIQFHMRRTAENSNLALDKRLNMQLMTHVWSKH